MRDMEQYSLPVYLRIGCENDDRDWEVGEVYSFSKYRYNSPHEAMLISASKAETVDSIPDIVLAYLTEERDKGEAVELIEEGTKQGGDILILTLLRIDAAKEFVMKGIDSVEDRSEDLSGFID